MTRSELLGELRVLVGNPDVNSVGERDLESALNASLEWLASELHAYVKTDDHDIALVADQTYYDLPSDLVSIISADWDTQPLRATSLYALDRSTSFWRQAASATPNQYFIQGRQIGLYPAPDASAVSTDGDLTIRYIASARPLNDGGTPGLSELDQWTALYKAAILYLVPRPSDENMARIQNYKLELYGEPGDRTIGLLAATRKRWQNMHETYHESFGVNVSRRRGAR